jgi:hypothetical protein
MWARLGLKSGARYSGHERAASLRVFLPCGRQQVEAERPCGYTKGLRQPAAQPLASNCVLPILLALNGENQKYLGRI